MLFLKQSTASQAVLIGPFVDSTDGVTAETGLTIANTDIRLSANGGNMAAKNSGGGTHDEAGWYTITLDATDTATVGRLQVSVAVSGALPVWAEFQVLEEAIYDALIGASATGLLPANVTQFGGSAGTFASGVPAVNATQISGDGTAADNLEAALDGTGGVTISAALTGNITGNLSGSVGSVTGAVGSVTGAVGSVTGAVGSVTGNVGGNVTGSVGSLDAQAKADVNAEVLDVLNVDTYSEPGQGAPTATPTIRLMVHYLYKWTRNKKDNNGSTTQFYADDATTVDHKQTTSAAAGTVTKSEIATGP